MISMSIDTDAVFCLIHVHIFTYVVGKTFERFMN